MNKGIECRSLLGPNALANNNNSNKGAQDGYRASGIQILDCIHNAYKKNTETNCII